MGWLDMHAHINMLPISESEALESCRAANVERVVTIGTCPADNMTAFDIAQRNYPMVHCCLGLHPHDAKDYTEEYIANLEPYYAKPEVIGVGEIGLDYYYEHSPVETQKQVFRAMLDLAHRVDLPVQIHTRDAEEDTIAILKEFEGKTTGLIHCFTSSKELARAVLDLGYNISISGVVTFKNAEALREIVKDLPLDRIHVETDSPFLAPVPQRGKKNEPSFVIHTAEFVANLKGIDLEELKQTTRANALKMFKKLNW